MRQLNLIKYSSCEPFENDSQELPWFGNCTFITLILANIGAKPRKRISGRKKKVKGHRRGLTCQRQKWAVVAYWSLHWSSTFCVLLTAGYVKNAMHLQVTSSFHLAPLKIWITAVACSCADSACLLIDDRPIGLWDPRFQWRSCLSIQTVSPICSPLTTHLLHTHRAVA